ncbi:MAG: hypothetical protein KQI35_02280 [Bacteroidetes bacterium]|nr:hypothetical protein [Bacteroidota bacterium]
MAGVIENIKRRFGDWILNRQLKKFSRHKKLVNLDEAVQIGIVYKVNSEKVFNAIKDLTKALTSTKKQVLAIGFVDRNDIPNYCVAANAGYYFSRKDLNWYGGPKNDYIKTFIDKEFDILIDLTLENVYINRYITGLSKSKFKVGPELEFTQPALDMMIKMDKDAMEEEYILQILHYLRMFKS